MNWSGKAVTGQHIDFIDLWVTGCDDQKSDCYPVNWTFYWQLPIRLTLRRVWTAAMNLLNCQYLSKQTCRVDRLTLYWLCLSMESSMELVNRWINSRDRWLGCSGRLSVALNLDWCSVWTLCWCVLSTSCLGLCFYCVIYKCVCNVVLRYSIFSSTPRNLRIQIL
jgi:hypothetical protein